MAQDYRITVKDWIRQATGAQDADEFEQTGITVLSISPFPEAIILAHPPENSEVFILAIQVDALDADVHPTLLSNVLQLNCDPDLLPGAFALEPQEQIVLYRWVVDLPGMDDTLSLIHISCACRGGPARRSTDGRSRVARRWGPRPGRT